MNRQSIQRLAGTILACLLIYRFSVDLAYLVESVAKSNASESVLTIPMIKCYAAICVVIGTLIWIVIWNADAIGRLCAPDRLSHGAAFLCASLRILMCYFFVMDIRWLSLLVAKEVPRIAEVSALYKGSVFFGGAWILVDILVFTFAPMLSEFLMRQAEMSFARRVVA